MQPNVRHPKEQEDERQGKDFPMGLKDEELVARAQENDQRAIRELFSGYHPKAYAIAYNMCSGDKEEAQDLTQDSFLKALRNIKKFRRNSSFNTWCYRIIVNTHLDRTRRRRTRERIISFWHWGQQKGEHSKDVGEEKPAAAEHSNPLSILSSKHLNRDIQKAMLSLPDKQRIVFQLKLLNGMSICEIAEVLESAEGTVKSHLFRATHSMREALKEWTLP
jgi:RNA polymerase sigma-70 factor (ECF subfamily)